MQSLGLTPNVKHYGSVVDLLGRAGRLQQAYYVIDSMPMLPDMVLWQTLLGACKTYKNVDMAEMVTRKLVEMGSTSDGNFVLLSNIYAARDEEKENALYQHSEKLAVAFGLICAEDEARPIQVIKNLRICGDCHVVIKLISKMYNREIIVRDRVRFHRFKDGTCSCRDYW
ncbi:unnamed protein product [Linum tenue]|uniref:DYW domain-containing protein n=1 Tax=Linum tenue TaxID=586396 RepID=A0AAV0NX44_9ROSI|nr:unnamed protein product [Linum tenue]CAI0462897.1 unnamed protein product [Linum tenue]